MHAKVWMIPPRWMCAAVERCTMRALAVLLVLGAVSPASAQSAAEIVRGRVVNDSARALVGAAVSITRGPDRLVLQDTTDADGRFSVRFEPGTGDYLVHVGATGFVSARRRVQREAAERDLVADFTLRPMPVLAVVRVTAVRPTRASSAVNTSEPGTGSSERWAEGANGQLPPTLAGDIGALAGTIPGVVVTPDGFSMLGAASTSNLTTMNGFELPVGGLPRAARTEARVSGATYDATRGGFAGANVDIRLAAGNRDYQNRNGYFTVEAPQLQLTDAVGRSLGARSGTVRGSLGADGELIRRRLVYNVALDFARTGNEPATLLSASPLALASAGLSADSAARLRSIASTLGVPVQLGGVPDSRVRDSYTWLGRLDEVSDSLRFLTLTSYASVTREGALGLAATSGPSTSASRRDATVGGQFALTQYVGAGHRILMQNKVAASRTTARVSPYLELPTAVVRVRSAASLASVSVGGALLPLSDDRSWTAEAANETFWNARGRAHRFKAQLWGRADGVEQTGIANAFGRYTYNSLEDFAANRPASFSRTLAQPVRDGRTWNSALAVSDEWTRSRTLSLIYGLRGEASGYLDAPPANPALDAALGVRTGVAPTQLRVSPRAGFTWVYNTDREAGTSGHYNMVGRFTRNQHGVVRGGIGEFRDLLRPGTLALARASGGLAGSTLQLTCVGGAVPVPDWDLFGAGGMSTPTECSGGGGLLAERAPSVVLLDPAFDVPRSWRASLNWMTVLRTFTVRVDALGSRMLSRPSTVDANFAGVPRFALASEGGRPVFVPESAIDATTGAVSSAAGRVSPDFGRVSVLRSDLVGQAGQLTVSVAPDLRRRRSRISLSGSASYTLQQSREQFRGFDGGAFGDPRAREWAAGASDVRHAVVVQGGFYHRRLGAITTFVRLQSGLPFTPLVGGDVNGDGLANDRAFVPVASGGGDAALAAQMQTLLAGAPGNVRDCLTPRLGEVAGRNVCRGPWTQSMNLQWSPPNLRRRVGGRPMSAVVYFQNPLGGLDHLINGADRLRGWGTQPYPDQTLLVPRGFDADAKRFRYDVNPRFGDTRAFRGVTRAPFRVSIDFSIDLGVPQDVQTLRRALEPVRVGGQWARRSADSIAALYLSRRTSNLYRLVMSESDSLLLTADQVARLRVADTAYIRRVRALYRPLGAFLAAQPENEVGQQALDTVKATEAKLQTYFWESVDTVATIVNPVQREMLPILRQMIAVPVDRRPFSFFGFGNRVELVDRPPPIRR